ncbi:MAG: adenylate/guanylate cyclase domain-containing protein [Bacteroidota bacterium]
MAETTDDLTAKEKSASEILLKVQSLNDLSESVIQLDQKRAQESALEAIALIGDEATEALLHQKARALNLLARCSFASNDYTQSLSYAEEALKVSTEIDNFKEQGYALLRLGDIHTRKYENDSAESCFEKALSSFQKAGYKSGEASVLSSLGHLYSDTGEFLKALEFYQKALAAFELVNDKIMIAGSLTNIGIIYKELGNYSSALEYYRKALPLHEENKHFIFKANTLCNVGSIYYEMGDYSQALEYNTQALHIYEEKGEKYGKAAALSHIGTIYGGKNEPEKSIEYYKKAIAIQQEIGDKTGEARALGNIGIEYCQAADFEHGIEFMQRSVAIHQETGNRASEAIALANLGAAHVQNNCKSADMATIMELYNRALSIAEEIQAKHTIHNCHVNLAEVYEIQKDWENFVIHFKKYHQLEKEMFSEDARKKQAQFEHQREIELIQQEQKATFKILNRVLPRHIVDRIKSGEENIADKYSSASVLFADIVGFTPLAEKLGADEVLKLLSGIFSHFDTLCEKFDVEKIKTIGDEYMVASGVPVQCEDHLERIARLALAMQEDIKLNLDFTFDELAIRIGIHTGEVIAGVLGTHKLSYDIWGDTVNTANRMESHGEPDKIHCSEKVFKALKDKFDFEERGEMEIKGKGKMKTYFLIGEK